MNSVLLERAYLVAGSFAFEVINSEAIGKSVIAITDCGNDENNAIFLVYGDELTEKASKFHNESRYKELLEVIAVNKEFVLEGYYGD